MKFPKIDYRWPLIVTLSVMCLTSVRKCSSNASEVDKLELDLALNKQTSDSIINKRNETVRIQKVIISQDKQTIKEYTDSIFNLGKKHEKKIKEVIAYYREITKTKINNVLIPYKDTTDVIKWKDEAKKAGEECEKLIDKLLDTTVFVNKSAVDSTKDHIIDVTVLKNGVRINEISLIDTQSLRYVILKGGFLKRNQEGKLKLFLKRSVQVQVIHTNKHLQTLNQQSLLYDPPKKRKWFQKAILIGGGIFIGTKL